MGVGSPLIDRAAVDVVVGKVVFRERNIHAFAQIAKIFLRQRHPVVFEMSEDEYMAIGRVSYDVRTDLFRRRDDK